MKLDGVLKGNIAINEGTTGTPLEINSAATTDVALVTGGGNVGIGTNAPTVKLDVNGTVKATTFSGPLSGNATNVSGTVAVANGGTGKTTIPVASGWVGGQTYAKGDVVYDNLVYYVRLTDGAGGTSPVDDSTNWNARTPTATTNGSSQANALLATNANSGIAVTAVGIGSVPVSAPSTGLSISNGGITITGVGNGINISSNGNLTLGATGNAGGSIAITNTTGVQLIKGSSGTSNHTLPTATGTLLNTASSLDPTKLSAGTAGIDISGNAATVTNGVTTATTSLPNVTSVNSTTIPASSTLLTSVSALDGGNLTASTVTSAKLASVTGTGTVVVTDTNPTLINPIKSGTQYHLRAVPPSVTTSITAAQLLGEWVTSAPSSAQNTALPAFSLLNATGVWLGGVNGCVDWSYINTGSATVTITSGTSHTVQSGNNATVAAGTSARFSTRLAANGASFITYRLA